MPTISCRIDRPSIDKFTKEQRATGERVTLSDTACSGLKLVINSQSASWVYTYRKRGYLDGGGRHPQRTMKLGDPATMTPAEARLAAEQIKAQVRAGGDPAIEPPHLNWSTAMFRKRRTENGEQATEAGRDSIEVTAS